MEGIGLASEWTGAFSPLELFFPIPSLSITSSLHCICRAGFRISTCSLDMERSSALSARSLRVADIRVVEGPSLDSASDSVLEPLVDVGAV